MTSRISPFVANVVLSILVFSFFFGIYFFLNSTTPNLPAFDDGYYHIVRAHSYWTGETLVYPTISTLARWPVNIYFGFHALLAPFTKVFTGANYDDLISSVKSFSSILAALYFVGIFLLSYWFGRHLTLSVRHSWFFGVLSALTLFVLFADFDFRLIMLRPHVISSLLVFCIVIFAALERVELVFLSSIIFPFFYSFSVIGLLPLFCFIVAKYIWNDFRFEKKLFEPLLAGTLGLVIGTLFRPDAFAYVINAIGVHTLVLVNRFMGAPIPGANELGFASIYAGSLPWLAPFLIVSFLVLSRTIMARTFGRVPFSYFYLTFTAFCLFLLYIVVNRTMEYFAPIAALSIVGFFALPKPSFVAGNNVWETISSLPEKLKEWFPMRTLFAVCAVVFVTLFLVNIFRIVKWNDELAPYDVYRNAAEFIEKDSKGKGTVFTQGYDVYSHLVFFNPKNSYIMGMDNVFAYTYSKELYWSWVHIMRGESVCPKERCEGETSRDMFDVIKNDFDSDYIFLDTSLVVAVTTPEGAQAFQARLEGDKRFKQVFHDEKYPSVFVYKLTDTPKTLASY